MIHSIPKHCNSNLVLFIEHISCIVDSAKFSFLMEATTFYTNECSEAIYFKIMNKIVEYNINPVVQSSNK